MVLMIKSSLDSNPLSLEKTGSTHLALVGFMADKPPSVKCLDRINM